MAPRLNRSHAWRWLCSLVSPLAVRSSNSICVYLDKATIKQNSLCRQLLLVLQLKALHNFLKQRGLPVFHKMTFGPLRAWIHLYLTATICARAGKVRIKKPLPVAVDVVRVRYPRPALVNPFAAVPVELLPDDDDEVMDLSSDELWQEGGDGNEDPGDDEEHGERDGPEEQLQENGNLGEQHGGADEAEEAEDEAEELQTHKVFALADYALDNLPRESF